MTFTTFAFDDVRDILVDNFGSGSITVEPSQTDANTVEGSLNASDELIERTTIRHDGDQLRITLPQQLFGGGNAHLRLDVPPGLGYSIRSGSADISISAVAARTKINSGSGDVSVAETGDLDCTTGSGDILITRLVGRAARLSTGSGDILITDAHCPLSAKSGSGDVTVKGLHRSAMTASSGSGDIAVPSTSGSVDLRSASGSLTVGVADGLPAWLDLNSVSGAVRIALDTSNQPEPGEPYVTVRARTASGEIAVYRA